MRGQRRFVDRHEGCVMSGFHYHGKPVSAQDVADILRHRLNWRVIQLRLHRERDERDGAIWRQLWAMIRGRL
jgi:hypothetical protein